jgi:hypothetical protein
VTWPPALPFVNAQLQQVKGQGFSADGATPAGDPVVLWSGELEAYFGEALLTENAAGLSDEVDRGRLWFPVTADGPQVVARGCTVVFTHNDGEPQDRTVLSIEPLDLVEVLRVTLEDQ